VASAFFHGDDMHLYYNMVSLMYKGRVLEPAMRTKSYLTAIAAFVALSGMFYVAAVFGLESIYGYGAPLTVPDCAVGFSGVLFAMKVHLLAAPHWNMCALR
jgi:rhomboid domain-containing protein 1